MVVCAVMRFFFFFQAEDGIRDLTVTGVQTCALPILGRRDGHVKAFAPLRAAPRPPPGVQLRLVARLRAAESFDDEGVGGELRAHRDVARDPRRERERRVVHDGVRRPRCHIEAMHEVELHDSGINYPGASEVGRSIHRSEEHTSELQSQSNLVCRLLLEKKKKCKNTYKTSSTSTRFTA